MADTAPGGVYQNPDGTYHDAQGNKIEKADAEARLAEYNRLKTAAGEKTTEQLRQEQEDTLAAAENRRRAAAGNVPVQPASGAGANAPRVDTTTAKTARSTSSSSGSAGTAGTAATGGRTPPQSDGADAETGASAGATSETGGQSTGKPGKTP